MVSKAIVVQNQVGLHARPATFFIQKSNEFKYVSILGGEGRTQSERKKLAWCAVPRYYKGNGNYNHRRRLG